MILRAITAFIMFFVSAWIYDINSLHVFALILELCISAIWTSLDIVTSDNRFFNSLQYMAKKSKL